MPSPTRFRPSPLRALAAITCAALSWAPTAHAAGSVEVIHWWTSAGETAAVGKFKEALTAKGVEWKDLAVGGADNQRTLLRTRVGKGSPPDAAMVNADVRALAANPDNLANLNELAAKGKWDSVLPEPVRRYVKMGGANYVMVPVGVHRQNLMWISTDSLKKIGAAAPPKTWDEFFAMADKAKAAGMVPLAMGEDPWVFVLFWQTAYSALQPDLFRKAFYDVDDAAYKSAEMTKTFDLMRRLRGYIDRGASTRKWNEGTQMVIQGKAFAQVMGDWAKGEFTVAGKKPNVDYVCAPVPGTASGHLFGTDAFMFFRHGTAAPAQMALAETLMDKNAQIQFNLLKGSVPVRTDADVSQFDDCAKQSYADFVAAGKSGTLAIHPQTMQSSGRIAAWRDVVLAHWNDPDMTSQKAAERLLAAAKAN